MHAGVYPPCRLLRWRSQVLVPTTRPDKKQPETKPDQKRNARSADRRSKMEAGSSLTSRATTVTALGVVSTSAPSILVATGTVFLGRLSSVACISPATCALGPLLFTLFARGSRSPVPTLVSRSFASLADSLMVSVGLRGCESFQEARNYLTRWGFNGVYGRVGWGKAEDG